MHGYKSAVTPRLSSEGIEQREMSQKLPTCADGDDFEKAERKVASSCWQKSLRPMRSMTTDDARGIHAAMPRYLSSRGIINISASRRLTNSQYFPTACSPSIIKYIGSSNEIGSIISRRLMRRPCEAHVNGRGSCRFELCACGARRRGVRLCASSSYSRRKADRGGHLSRPSRAEEKQRIIIEGGATSVT